VLLVSHAGPTEPELPPLLEELLLDELLLDVPDDPDDPEEPEEPELLLLLAPVSGAVAASTTAGVPLSSVPGVFVGSVVVFAPASGAGSAAFVS
jgi:hypothetical protein